ncbi:hypothetical protein M7I_8334 [Glarea lozoyensis 74030]|uniref:Uncharacterized protein n=1 Tax=Glarea lozoyensis (strain ATCC 74030 / MF5533) TaxID=1104152 RepID=H0EZQ7_GLAL7|nr:hypothetical protein M7I_8334 [Glarea lozoyensis 74030]
MSGLYRRFRLNKLCHYPLPPPESGNVATPFSQEVGNGSAVYQPVLDQEAFPELLSSYVSDDVDQSVEQELGLGSESRSQPGSTPVFTGDLARGDEYYDTQSARPRGDL